MRYVTILSKYNSSTADWRSTLTLSASLEQKQNLRYFVTNHGCSYFDAGTLAKGECGSICYIVEDKITIGSRSIFWMVFAVQDNQRKESFAIFFWNKPEVVEWSSGRVTQRLPTKLGIGIVAATNNTCLVKLTTLGYLTETSRQEQSFSVYRDGWKVALHIAQMKSKYQALLENFHYQWPIQGFQDMIRSSLFDQCFPKTQKWASVSNVP